MYDVTIIGAGVIGTAMARLLSQYELKVCLIDRSDDVASGATKANSGIIHGAYATKYGSLKAKLAREGNQLYDDLEASLHFGFERIGAFVLAFDEEEAKELDNLYANGIKNGCSDMEILSGDEARKLEPELSEEVVAVLFAKDVGIASPYEMAIALAENALANGVELKLGFEVKAIERLRNAFVISGEEETISSKYVINAAGMYSDKISEMILGRDPGFKILPRKGQYVLLDRQQGKKTGKVLFQVPTKLGKGILVTRTLHGNLMLGPNAEDLNDREDYGTDIESLKDVVAKAKRSVPNIEMKRAITTYSGVRAISNTGDFIVSHVDDDKFAIQLAGIDSPGLTAAPAIANMALELLKAAGLELVEKESFIANRPAIIRKKSLEEQLSTEAENPEKKFICRCERVTEAEIIDALGRGIPIVSTDMIKRRTRAGMGPCQGQYCRPRVTALIEAYNQVEGIGQRGPKEGTQPERVPLSEVKKL